MSETDPGDLGDDLARLFQADRAAAADPTADVRARLRGRLSTTLGVPFAGGGPGGGPGAGGHEPPPNAPPAGPSLPPAAAVGAGTGAATGHGLAGWLAGKGAAVAIAFALGGAAGALGHAAVSNGGARVETVAAVAVTQVAAAPVAAPVIAPPLASIEEPLPAPSHAASTPPVRAAVSASAERVALPNPSADTSAQPRQRDADLAAERQSLELARTAVMRGQPAAALAALDEDAARFPHGRLGLEREILVIQALAAAGRRSEARDRAAQFEAKHPTSLLVPAARAAAGVEAR